MSYVISQWPDSVQQKEIGGLSTDAAAAVMVMLRTMRKEGPWPRAYKIKPLKKRLHGINQVNLKINKEQIRVLYSVSSAQIVLLHVFHKTSAQLEQRGYDLALKRKKTAEAILKGD